MPGDREQFPTLCAAEREWAWPDIVTLQDYPALAGAWAHSQDCLLKVREYLSTAKLSPHVQTVAVSGSFGRMEAGRYSDCDLIVVLAEGISSHESTAAHAWESVWQALEPLGLKQPRAGGIFATPTTAAELCDPNARGRIDEHIPTFGKRFQLLWDAQPVYGDEAYNRLLSEVLDWYTTVLPDDHRSPWWRYLLNDSIRYYRSLCVNYQWETSGKPGRRQLRNWKFAFSRRVMYAALLCLLGEGSLMQAEPVAWLQSRLRLTPLERLAWCYQLSGQSGFEQVAASYDDFLGSMAEKGFREALGNPQGDEQLNLSLQADNLMGELSRFISCRQVDWDETFAVSLLF